MKTLKYLNLDSCKPIKIQIVWRLNTTESLIITGVCIHAKILVQKYPLNKSRTSQSSTELCPCCKD